MCLPRARQARFPPLMWLSYCLVAKDTYITHNLEMAVALYLLIKMLLGMAYGESVSNQFLFFFLHFILLQKTVQLQVLSLGNQYMSSCLDFVVISLVVFLFLFLLNKFHMFMTLSFFFFFFNANRQFEDHFFSIYNWHTQPNTELKWEFSFSACFNI